MPVVTTSLSLDQSREAWPSEFVDQASVILGDPWFAHLNSQQQQHLLSSSQSIFLAQAEVFAGTEPACLHNNDLSQSKVSLFLLLEGRLSIEYALNRASQRNLTLLGWLRAGQWWFEMGQPSMADAELAMTELSFVAQTPCELRVIKPVALRALIAEPSFLLKLMQLQAMTSRAWLASLANFHMRSTLARTAHRLWLLCLHSGKATADTQESSPIQHDLAISQSTLANLLGVTRQSIIQSLQELATRQLIIQNYGRIQVINPAGLVAIFRA